MGAFASSFEVRTDSPSAVAAGLLSALTEVQRPAFALVFCSGKLVTRMGELALALRSKANVPIVLASGPGVLSERRELEGESAATGIACAGRPPQWSICPHDEALTQERLGALLGQPAPGESVLLFLRSEGFNPQLLWQLRQTHRSPALFGAGTHGDPGLLCVRGQEVVRASAVALRLAGFGRPSIHTAHSCRLLAPPMPITRCRGSMVEELEGKPALSVLERLGAGLKGQPLVFTVLASATSGGGAPDLLVRGIQGVDPSRGSLLISEEAEVGALLTFAVRDAGAAREDMARICRQAARELAGAAPRFALYFNCSGRGKALHNAPNVDTRILKETFPGTHVAGFQSAFEIGPFDGAPALQLYTGMLGVFAAAS